MSKPYPETYNSRSRRYWAFLIILLVVIALLFVSGSLLGYSTDGSLTFIKSSAFSPGALNDIIWNIRIPRLFSALIAGFGLALAGVVMQSILRNPLGSPFTLGISNAAAFGAAFAIVLFHRFMPTSGMAHSLIISGSAFFWAAIACLFILIVARLKGVTPENMILTGIIVSALFAALTSGLQFLADDIQLGTLVFWTFGDLSKGNWNNLMIQVIIILPTAFYFFWFAHNFNAMDFGDDTAQSLGVNVSRFRLVSMLLASLITAIVVSSFGIIAFVGLVVPHIIRKLIGPNEIYLLPVTALAGSAFILACDLIARVVISPVIIPVGIITSIIGAPVFIYILIRSKGFSQWN